MVRRQEVMGSRSTGLTGGGAATAATRPRGVLWLTVIGVTMGVLAVGALAIAGMRPDARPALLPTVSGSPVQAATAGRVMGDPGAPVTIDIWSDFQCPACGRLARELEPRLIADHVIPGTVRIVYHDMAFLGDESVLAAIGSRYAAEQDAFWPYHDLLFANQDGENQGAFRVERLVAIAEAAGLDPVGFRRSLADSAARAAVIKETQAGAAAGVSSTPTLFVNGTPYVGLPDYASLSAYIDELASS